MAYEFILDAATDAAKRRYSNGHSPAPDDTVCVLFTTNGQIYTGISSITVQGGASNSIHAEVDAVNRMRASGETTVQAMTVLNSYSMVPVLPCSGCINLILSLNYENSKCLIVFPGGSVRITEVGMNFNSPADQVQRNQANNPYGGSQQQNYNYGQGQGTSVYQNVGNSVYMNQMARQLSPVSRQMSQISRQTPQTMSAVPPPYPSGSSGNGTGKENNYLKNKLNNLLAEDDDEEQEQKPKKKRGLFG